MRVVARGWMPLPHGAATHCRRTHVYRLVTGFDPRVERRRHQFRLLKYPPLSPRAHARFAGLERHAIACEESCVCPVFVVRGVIGWQTPAMSKVPGGNVGQVVSCRHKRRTTCQFVQATPAGLSVNHISVSEKQGNRPRRRHNALHDVGSGPLRVATVMVEGGFEIHQHLVCCEAPGRPVGQPSKNSVPRTSDRPWSGAALDPRQEPRRDAPGRPRSHP